MTPQEIFAAIEEHFDADPGSYYNAFRVVDVQSPDIPERDLTSWLEYFTYGAAREFDKVREKVLKLSRDIKLKEKFGGQQIFLGDRQVKIMEYIQEVGELLHSRYLL